MNRVKMILTLVVVLCSVHAGFAQSKQITQITSENLKVISWYVDEVKESLDSGGLTYEEEQQNLEKLKTLSVLQQSVASMLQDLISGGDLEQMSNLGQNAIRLAEIAKLVYTEQVPPTLQAVFEIMNNESDDVIAGELEGFPRKMPNIYANIGQTPVYQKIMHELHDTFRLSATTPEGGGFGENDATPN